MRRRSMMLKYSTNNRNNEWLEGMLYELWENHFDDVPRQNIVIIKFGKRSKRQLGCLRMLKKPNNKFDRDLIKTKNYNDINSVSVIAITSIFKLIEIPEIVVTSTIAHELCHYAHGFNSPLPRKFKHPHKGGVIRKELAKRGLLEAHKSAHRWLKTNWKGFIQRF